MQQFDDSKGERRFLDIKKMERKDVGDYYLQHLGLTQEKKHFREEELRKKIKQSKMEDSYQWILAIKFKEGRVIGKIEVLETGEDSAFVTINLPNKNFKLRYGEEALDQFIKICEENHYFSTIELEKNNSIVEKYILKHGLGYKIEVA